MIWRISIDFFSLIVSLMNMINIIRDIISVIRSIVNIKRQPYLSARNPANICAYNPGRNHVRERRLKAVPRLLSSTDSANIGDSAGSSSESPIAKRIIGGISSSHEPEKWMITIPNILMRYETIMRFLRPKESENSPVPSCKIESKAE